MREIEDTGVRNALLEGLQRRGKTPESIPYGRLVCTCTLAGAWQTEHWPEEIAAQYPRVLGPRAEEIWPDLYGDYSPGRWVWHLTNVRSLPDLGKIRGHQGFFDVFVPGYDE